MKVAVFSAKPYDQRFLDAANRTAGHSLSYFDVRLSIDTCGLAATAQAVCVFVNDLVNAEVTAELAKQGVRLIVLRCAGFNNVDLVAARTFGMTVARVPAYSPHAVAEHTIALILALNRKIHRSFNRVREGNFALEGLLGFDLNGKTAGIVGTGKIGAIVARILLGFGCKVVASDPDPNPDCEKMGVRYLACDRLFAVSDIVTFHCPLTPGTYHLVNVDSLKLMKRGVMLINTSRGAVVDTRTIILGLKQGAIGSVGLDVYEEEADLFFQDLSDRIIADDVFARLLTFPNVLITGHQGYFTEEALSSIAQTTIANIKAFESTGNVVHEVTPEKIVGAPR
jgi:D-lactate dehydrogenase